MEVFEIRCPVGPRKLLFKMLQGGEKPAVTDGNLIELHCPECSRTERRKDPLIMRVVHRYDLAGDLVTSERLYRDAHTSGR